MQDPREPVSGASHDVAVWDGATRLFHWLLVVLVASAWASNKWGDAGLVWHTWNGYAVLVLVVWRLIWGRAGCSPEALICLGTRNARAISSLSVSR